MEERSQLQDLLDRAYATLTGEPELLTPLSIARVLADLRVCKTIVEGRALTGAADSEYEHAIACVSVIRFDPKGARASTVDRAIDALVGLRIRVCS